MKKKKLSKKRLKKPIVEVEVTAKKMRPLSPKGPKAKGKIEKVMEEFKEGALHSGSKKGPKVKNRKQAVAIALSEARKAKK